MGARARRALTAGIVLVVAAVASAPATAEPMAVWVATHDAPYGGQVRMAALPDGTAWAVLQQNRIVKSVDFGRTWQPVNLASARVAGIPLPYTGPDLGGSSRTYVAPLNSSVAYASNNDVMSRTTDGGVTWQAVTPPPKVTKSALGREGGGELAYTGGQVWAAREGLDRDADFCARLLPTTPLFALADGKRWVRRDIPLSGGRIENITFADRNRGVAIVFDLTLADPDPDSCNTGGVRESSGVYITSDGGRHWRRTFTCKPVCFAVSWSTPRRVVLGNVQGQVFTSDDNGAHFAPGSTLIPNVASPYRGLDGLACIAKRCYAQSRGVVFRSDDAGAEWVEEITPSGGSLLIGDLAMFDRERAIGVGPYTIITRGTAPAGAR